MPFSPLAKTFGFVLPPPYYFIILVGIIAAYLFVVQMVKSWFVKKYGYQ